MRKKSENKKGFTLAELLIVVAIIAVLLAILVPVFSSSRNKAILEKDAANVRSAYSEAVTEAMTDKSYTGGELTVKPKKPDNLQCDVSYDSTSRKLIVSFKGKPDLKEEITVDEDIKIASDGDWIKNAGAGTPEGGGEQTP